MITCDKAFFLARCEQRGKPIADAMQCVVAQDGDQWTIDTDHVAFPRATPPQSERGPGTELSRLLQRFGISPTPTCSCRAKAAEMDRWGCDEAAKPERIDEVVSVMRAEAAARGLPFLDAVGRMLVRRAIANARREEARHAKEKARESGSPAV